MKAAPIAWDTPSALIGVYERPVRSVGFHRWFDRGCFVYATPAENAWEMARNPLRVCQISHRAGLPTPTDLRQDAEPS